MKSNGILRFTNLKYYDTKIKNWFLDKINTMFSNKDTLDKISESDNGNLLFNGEEIKGGGNTNIHQYVLENVIAGQSYNIGDDLDLSDGKFIVQAYEQQQGEQDVVKDLAILDDEHKDEFIYDENCVSFEGGCHLITEFPLEMTQNEDGLWETPIIKTNDYIDMKIVEKSAGGVQ